MVALKREEVLGFTILEWNAPGCALPSMPDGTGQGPTRLARGAGRRIPADGTEGEDICGCEGHLFVRREDNYG